MEPAKTGFKDNKQNKEVASNVCEGHHIDWIQV